MKFVAYLCPECGRLYKSFRRQELAPPGVDRDFPGRCYHSAGGQYGKYHILRRFTLDWEPDQFENGGEPEYNSHDASWRSGWQPV